MIIVTGGAGFIGSNLVKALNLQGIDNILVVDHLGKGEKFKNLNAVKFQDFLDKNEFLGKLDQFRGSRIEAIFHEGACSDTMEYDGDYMMKNNYQYSKELLNFAIRNRSRFLYASSASVYGDGKRGFTENGVCECPLNVYAFSKYLFDRYVLEGMKEAETQIVGLRYFNVFGPQENHKGKMASIIRQFYDQLADTGMISLFKGMDGYGDGEQKRDFIYVKDVAKVNLFFFLHGEKRGIFNCGTGNASSFNQAARALIRCVGKGGIRYIDFPEVLRNKYQSYTRSDGAKLQEAGYDAGFMLLEEAIEDYYRHLAENSGYLNMD